jgi:hypothetical protein
MQIATYKFSDHETRIPKPINAGTSGTATFSRNSPVLTRRELKRLIMEMVD